MLLIPFITWTLLRLGRSWKLIYSEIAMEQLPNQTPLPEQPLRLDITNKMQIELAKIFKIDLIEWADKYAEGFRKLISDDPSLVDDYGKGMPGSLELIQEKLRSTVH